ncbi:MAG TPA: phosphate acetyltransferase [Candidatus Brocadiia bacterium]|nr:phosphate acetyltransferase [Candidatus Brocadiia bacterium]
MDLIQKYKDIVRGRGLRVVYPEGNDERLIRAAAECVRENLARPTLLGKPDEIAQKAREAGVALNGVQVLDPGASDKVTGYAELYVKGRDDMSVKVAARLVRKPFAFGAMMLKAGDADLFVGGATVPTAIVIQAASLCAGFEPGISTPSSFFLMDCPQAGPGGAKQMLYADCAINISPNARELAEIAVCTARTAKSLLGREPKTALLSFSTHGSASHADAEKVIEATKLAREMAPGFVFDGELQLDSAISPKVAAKKCPDSPIAGQADVFIFPDLDAGNIAYKLTQYFGGAKAIGPILQGFAKPASDLSRGASVEDVVSATAILGVMAGKGT